MRTTQFLVTTHQASLSETMKSLVFTQFLSVSLR
jgi:hypothetical protein